MAAWVGSVHWRRRPQPVRGVDRGRDGGKCTIDIGCAPGDVMPRARGDWDLRTSGEQSAARAGEPTVVESLRRAIETLPRKGQRFLAKLLERMAPSLRARRPEYGNERGRDERDLGDSGPGGARGLSLLVEAS